MEAQPHVETNALIPSISIEALLAARDEAHRIYFETAEQLRAASEKLSRFGVTLPSVGVHFPGNEYLPLCDADSAFAIKREIDRFVWVQLFELTNIDTIMDHKTRNDLFEQLQKSQRYLRRLHGKQPEVSSDDMPELTAENIEAVFRGVQDNQLEYFEKCVESVFKALSWDHSTNEPGKIGKKLITNNAFYPWSRSMQGDSVSLSHHEHIHDLERVLCILNGEPPATHSSKGLRTIGNLTYGKWYDVPSPSGGDPLMSIICYRKGTAHIKILNAAHRDDMNRIMARRYPGSISEPQGTRRSQWASEQAQRPKTSNALAKTDKQARQAFYTPEVLAEELVTEAIGGEWEGHGKTVLEPSAGGGALVRAALRTRCSHVTAIENDPHGIEMLGYLRDRVNVHGDTRMAIDPRDFFDVSPASYPELFDVVVMNPPFSNAQEVEHVLHAWEFVKPGGRLVAIMSNAVQWRTDGRYRVFADFLERTGAEIKKNPASSFKESGTNVETLMVVIDKPKT